MRYDLSNTLHLTQFLAKANALAKEGKGIVELTLKRPKTLKQNAYIHVCIAYFATQIGETAEYCKRRYLKQICNKDIFLREKQDKVTKDKVKYLRSWADLTKEEAQTAIDRFITWASKECDIYIPSPEDKVAVQQMELEIERNKAYL